MIELFFGLHSDGDGLNCDALHVYCQDRKSNGRCTYA